MRRTWIATSLAAVALGAIAASVAVSTPVAQAEPFVAPPGWDSFMQQLATAQTAVFKLSAPQLGAHGASASLYLAADRNLNRVAFYPTILGDGAEKIFILSGQDLWRIPPSYRKPARLLPQGPAAQAIALEVMSGLTDSSVTNEQGGVMVRFPFPWATGMSVLVDTSRTSVPKDVAAPGALFFTGWGMGATLFIHDVVWNVELPPSFYAEPSGVMASTLVDDLRRFAVDYPLKFESKELH